MFIGCFTTHTEDWFSDHRKDEYQRYVEDWLKSEATKAIADATSMIWLYWPYFDPHQAGPIKLILDKFAKELKRNPFVTKRIRYFSVPVHRADDTDAQFAVLYVGVK
jgi:hypothetical protein